MVYWKKRQEETRRNGPDFRKQRKVEKEMKTRKTLLSLLLGAVLVFSLCAAGGAVAYADGEHPAEAAQTYTMFAMGYAGQIADASQLDGSSAVVLNADGTGNMSFDDESMGIKAWSLEGNQLAITFADGSSLTGILHMDQGVIEMNYGYTIYYGREGADTEAYLAPDTRLYALFHSVDQVAGAHLKYALHTDYMDADSLLDVYTKDGIFYSSKTTQVSGYESTTVTFYRDGSVYSLDPEKLTGMFVTSIDPTLLEGSILALDDLFRAVQSRALRTDFTTETRDVDGVSCTVDVYPATDYEPEGAFYFDSEGKLIRYIEGAPVIDTGIDIGESVYTIESIDTAVNESLFDISGYQITA